MGKNDAIDWLDDTDRALLALLQADGRMSNARLAEALALSETPCWRRMRRLEAEGYIEGYQANVSRLRLGYGVLALVEVGFANHADDAPERFETAVQGIPEILSCHNVTGAADYVLEVVARDLPAYGQFVAEVLRRLPGVTSLRSSLSLREVKATTRLPLPSAV
ncbi:MAG: AsnC family transcriptional regulator [Desulfovibrionaceae bacterium CG1_02_65_16]|nr:MAG: AsnC family transcriptional regulator [Desulfovibrionaceae bacterium CG1_02_65_16]